LIDTKAIRTKVLDLAFQGKLTDQRVEEGTGEELLFKIQNSRLDHTKSSKAKKLSVNDTIIPPFSIPHNWIWVRFSDLIDLTNGTASRGTSGGVDIPVLRLADLSEFNINTRNIRLVKLSDSEYKSHILMRDDLIIIRVNGSKEKVGRAYIYTDEKEISYCDHLFCGHPYSKLILPEYIMLALSQSDLRKQIIPLIKTTAGQNTINQTGLGKVVLPFPSQGEQKRIVRLINQVFSVLDTIDDLQTRYAKDIDTLKAKLIENGLQGKLTEQLPEEGTAEELYQQIQAEKQRLVKAKKIKKEQPLPPIETKDIPFPIPTNWKWVRLGDITRKIASGNTPTGGRNSGVYVQNGYCLFREQNIYNDGIHEEGMVYITEELLATRENCTVYAGDILLNITGGSIGRCAVVPDSFDRGSVNQHILIIRMIDERLRHYIHKVICSPYAQKYINQKAFGDKGGFSGTRCKMMPIPLPPLEEQKRIVERIDSIYASI